MGPLGDLDSMEALRELKAMNLDESLLAELDQDFDEADIDMKEMEKLTLAMAAGGMGDLGTRAILISGNLYRTSHLTPPCPCVTSRLYAFRGHR